MCVTLRKELNPPFLAQYATLLDYLPAPTMDLNNDPPAPPRAVTRPEFWRGVQGGLLPQVAAACRAQLAAANAASPHQDAVFRDVALSAVTCSAPGCTNLAGEREAGLRLLACGLCGEARYCSKWVVRGPGVLWCWGRRAASPGALRACEKRCARGVAMAVPGPSGGLPPSLCPGCPRTRFVLLPPLPPWQGLCLPQPQRCAAMLHCRACQRRGWPRHRPACEVLRAAKS